MLPRLISDRRPFVRFNNSLSYRLDELSEVI